MTSRVLILAPSTAKRGAGEETMFCAWPVDPTVETKDEALLGTLKIQTTLREGPVAGCAELPYWPPVGIVAGLSGGASRHLVSSAWPFETCLFFLEGPKCAEYETTTTA